MVPIYQWFHPALMKKRIILQSLRLKEATGFSITLVQERDTCFCVIWPGNVRRNLVGSNLRRAFLLVRLDDLKFGLVQPAIGAPEGIGSAV